MRRSCGGRCSSTSHGNTVDETRSSWSSRSSSTSIAVRSQRITISNCIGDRAAGIAETLRIGISVGLRLACSVIWWIRRAWIVIWSESLLKKKKQKSSTKLKKKNYTTGFHLKLIIFFIMLCYRLHVRKNEPKRKKKIYRIIGRFSFMKKWLCNEKKKKKLFFNDIAKN